MLCYLRALVPFVDPHYASELLDTLNSGDEHSDALWTPVLHMFSSKLLPLDVLDF